MRGEKKDTSAVKQKPARNGCSGRPNKRLVPFCREGHGVTASWPVKANIGVRGRVRAAEKATE